MKRGSNAVFPVTAIDQKTAKPLHQQI